MNKEKAAKVVSTKQPLSPAQCATLDALADLMIPASPDGRMPAASALNLYADSRDLPPRVVAAFECGLAALDAAAAQQHGKPFAQLVTSEARQIVDQLRGEARSFFGAFTVQTLARYHQHDIVMPLIGLPARPPWPEGNVVKQGDWSLLDPVRARDKIYRDV